MRGNYSYIKILNALYIIIKNNIILPLIWVLTVTILGYILKVTRFCLFGEYLSALSPQIYSCILQSKSVCQHFIFFKVLGNLGRLLYILAKGASLKCFHQKEQGGQDQYRTNQ